MRNATVEWPALPYEEWRATRDTLHMYTQVIGKLRLALSPFEPGWANVALYVTARGLTTSPIRVGSRIFDAEFDFIDHVLVMRSTDGGIETRPLGGPVADFYSDVVRALSRMHIDADISVLPSEVSDPVPFPDDRSHETYERDQATAFHRALAMIDAIMKRHHARFRGWTSPVHFFWGTFDLALTRYAGRHVDPPAGAGTIARFGGEEEEICAGWWPGSERVRYPAFFAYAYPAPQGIEGVRLQPGVGAWNDAAGEFLLPYEELRTQPEAEQLVLAFLETTYAGAAHLLGWSADLTRVDTPAPTGG